MAEKVAKENEQFLKAAQDPAYAKLVKEMSSDLSVYFPKFSHIFDDSGKPIDWPDFYDTDVTPLVAFQLAKSKDMLSKLKSPTEDLAMRAYIANLDRILTYETDRNRELAKRKQAKADKKKKAEGTPPQQQQQPKPNAAPQHATNDGEQGKTATSTVAKQEPPVRHSLASSAVSFLELGLTAASKNIFDSMCMSSLCCCGCDCGCGFSIIFFVVAVKWCESVHCLCTRMVCFLPCSGPLWPCSDHVPRRALPGCCLHHA